MNPSASGWIKKLLKEVSELAYQQTDTHEYYTTLRETGFIYGSNISVVLNSVKSFDFSEEERSKMNLMLSFYYIYNKETTNKDFVESLIQYYKTIVISKPSVIDDLFGEKKSYNLLEKIIHKRIYIDDNFMTKNFNFFLINALLFVDVLGYQRFLRGDQVNIKDYVSKLELSIETIIFKVIERKTKKTEYDYNLVKLFESSLRYKNSKLPLYSEAFSFLSEPLEKLYVIDLVCMASWTDKIIDSEELNFLDTLKK